MKTYTKYALIALAALVVVSMIVCGTTMPSSEAKGKPPTKTPAPTNTPGGSTNYVQNPGFETGELDPWYPWNDAAISDVEQRSGSYCARVGAAEASVEQVVTGLSPSTTYRLTAWAKLGSSANGRVEIGVKEFDAGMGTFVNPTSSSTYEQLSIDFTTGPSHTEAKVFCYRPLGNNNAYCDDFVVEEPPPPPTDTPMPGTGTPIAPGTYYVDCSAGTDGDGSQSSPWNNLATVSGTTFDAGSSILFMRGTMCTGQLWPKGSGSSGSPIVIDAYGTGTKPIIAGGGVDSTVYLYNQEYWEIRNLEVTNVGTGSDELIGIHVHLTDFGTGDYYRILNNTVHDIAGEPETTNKATGGIMFIITGNSTQTKFNDVLIEGNVVDGNVNRSGIFTTGWGAWDNRPSVCGDTGGGNWIGWTNFVVRSNTVNDVAGDAIVLLNTLDGLVEYNVASHFQARTTIGATAGIWSWDSTGTVFQYNEAYLADGTWDGQGFDIDYGNDGTIMQYNYSHDNDGGFMLICSMCEGGNTDGTVRYNISQNDGISGEPVFELSGKTSGIKVYNNTVYTTRSQGTMIHEWDWNGYTLDATWNNNIFWNGGGLTYELYGNNTFDYNIFYGQHPASEPSDPHKITDDPLLVNPGSGGTGIGTVGGYQLQAGSPAIGAGVVIADNGGEDYWGNPIPTGCAPDIGAHQYATDCSATPTPAPTATTSPPTATPDPGSNPVENPGFETGELDPWYAWEQAAVVDHDAHSGTYAAAVGTGAASVEQVVSGLARKTTYVLYAWGKCPDGADVKIGVKDYGGNQVLDTITSSSYSQAEVWFTTGAPNTTATIFCYNESGDHVVYCDDFSMIEQP